MTLTFVVTLHHYSHGGRFMRLTGINNSMHKQSLEYAEPTILAALNPKDDEEIVVTFTKRKKNETS